VRAEEPWGLDPAIRDRLVAGVGTEVELDVADQSGLTEALGGREAAAVALVQAWGPHIRTVTTTLGTVEPPVKLASTMEVAAAAPNSGEGMFGGYMVAALGAKGVVSYSNELPGGTPVSGPFGDSHEITVDLSTERARMTLATTHENDGLKTVVKTTVDVA